jgi:hypothetical protein
MAVVANQAVAFDKSMLTACPHLGDVLRPGLILDHGLTGQNRKAGRRILKQTTPQGGGVSKAQRAFAVLPPQDMRIGATLYIRGFSSLVASTAALIATGWSELAPGRVYSAVDQRLHVAHGNGV